jgi:microcin C transport system permease protein
MNVFTTTLAVAAILVAGFLLSTRALPRAAVRGLRALGFRAQAAPATAKRIARFKRIRRGYWSFLAIVTLFSTSLFLEVFVNGRALAVHYDGRTAFPALAEWAGKALPFLSISHFERRGDFGQLGESEVDYRAFARACADPAVLDRDIAEARGRLDEDRAKLAALEASAAPSDAPRVEVRRRAVLRRAAEVDELERARAVFAAGRAWVVMPLYPFGPGEFRHDLPTNPPNAPSLEHGIPLGTDDSGRDVLVLLLYGFRISLAFALLVAACGYVVGIVVGGVQGYYGGWTDIVLQRFEEIWSAIPFLFVIMIIASLVRPTFMLLVVLMVVLLSWLNITFYVRAEFYREKAKDYVHAAVGCGVPDWKVMARHILPNALVPVVTFAPFAIVAYIGSLVSLDFLGFGLPPGTPSWGGLLKQGLEHVKFHPHLIIVPTVALASTLFAVVMIGEAVREAFDPKVFSRLR